MPERFRIFRRMGWFDNKSRKINKSNLPTINVNLSASHPCDHLASPSELEVPSNSQETIGRQTLIPMSSPGIASRCSHEGSRMFGCDFQKYRSTAIGRRFVHLLQRYLSPVVTVGNAYQEAAIRFVWEAFHSAEFRYSARVRWLAPGEIRFPNIHVSFTR